MASTAIDYYSEQNTLLTNQRGDRLIRYGEGGGVIRNYYAYFKNTTGADIVATKTISLLKVPAGRLLPHLSFIKTSDFGSTGSLDVGWNEYKENDTDTVVADPDGIIDGLDTSGQAVAEFLSATASGSVATVRSPGLIITGFAEIFATLMAANMQANATIELYLAMVSN